MTDLMKGLSRIHFLVSRSKKLDQSNVDKLVASKDENVKFAMTMAKDNGLNMVDMLTKVKAVKGVFTMDVAKKIGFKSVAQVADAKGKKKKDKKKHGSKKDECKGKDCEEKQEKKDASTKKIATQTKGNAVRLVVPKRIDCPDEDDDGNEVFLVIGKDGLVGCGVMANNPTD